MKKKKNKKKSRLNFALKNDRVGDSESHPQPHVRTGISEWSSHDDGFVAEFFIVVINFGHWLHTGVFEHFELLLIGVDNVPE